MRLLSLLLAIAAGAFGQAISTPGASTLNPNQVTVSTAYLYYNKMHYAGTWSVGTTYNSQDVVSYSGLTYVSNQTANIGNTPSSSAAWTAIGGGGGAAWGSISGTLSAQADLNSALAAKLAIANNLSDLANVVTARTNLGLGTAAVQNVGFFLQSANNLSDLANAVTARTNLGLGTAATQTWSSANIISLWSGCSGVLLLGADGACHAGGTGTPCSTTPGAFQYNNSGAFGCANVVQNTDGTLSPSKTLSFANASTPTFHAGGTTTVDWTASNYAHVTASGGNTTLAFTAPTTSSLLMLELTNDSIWRVWTAPVGLNTLCVPPFATQTEWELMKYDAVAGTYEVIACNNNGTAGINIQSGTINGVTTNTGYFCGVDGSSGQWTCSNTSGVSVSTVSRVASGASALATSTIASAACGLTTVAATGVLTTDVIQWVANGSLSSTTGYIPSTSGGLTIQAYPTAGNINFNVCNWTSSGITPGAVTINWFVWR